MHCLNNCLMCNWWLCFLDFCLLFSGRIDMINYFSCVIHVTKWWDNVLFFHVLMSIGYLQDGVPEVLSFKVACFVAEDKENGRNRQLAFGCVCPFYFGFGSLWGGICQEKQQKNIYKKRVQRWHRHLGWPATVPEPHRSSFSHRRRREKEREEKEREKKSEGMN